VPNEVTTQGEAAKRLKDVFGQNKLKEDDLADYAKVLRLMSSNGDFEAALNSLSAELWDLYRGMAKEEKNKFSRSLIQFATTKAGFPPQHATLLCAGADDYLEYIKKGLLLKDGMHAGHGEYSHTFQWLAAACANLQLNSSVGRLYQALGDERMQKSKKAITTEGEAGIVSLWSYLVDAFPIYSAKQTDIEKGTDSLHTATYRSPQNVMKYLLADTDKGHFLSVYLQRRYTKRNWFTGKDVQANFGKATIGTALASYTEQKYAENANYNQINNKTGNKIVGFEQKNGTATKYSNEESAQKHDEENKEEVIFHGKPGVVYWKGSSS
jgi:hypothetical protein